MLRELNVNEMKMVSGGDAPRDPRFDETTGMMNTNNMLSAYGVETWGSAVPDVIPSGGILPDTSGQAFDATFGQSSTYGTPDPSKKERLIDDDDVCTILQAEYAAIGAMIGASFGGLGSIVGGVVGLVVFEASDETLGCE